MSFNRRLNIAISDAHTTRIYDERLQISARVTKSIESSEPDNCELEIVNLNSESRDFIGNANTISISAGYGDDISSIFLGDIMNVHHEHIAADRITFISSGTSGKQLQVATMNTAYIGGSKLEAPLLDLAESLKVELELIGNPDFKDSSLSRAKSFTLDSKIHLDQISRAHGLNWAIQDGKLIILKIDQHREAVNPVLLDYSSGLLNSPQVDFDDKTKTIRLKAICLLNNAIFPANKVVVKSDALIGKVGGVQISRTEFGEVAVNVKQVVHNINSRVGEFTTALDGVII